MKSNLFISYACTLSDLAHSSQPFLNKCWLVAIAISMRFASKGKNFEWRQNVGSKLLVLLFLYQCVDRVQNGLGSYRQSVL